MKTLMIAATALSVCSCTPASGGREATKTLAGSLPAHAQLLCEAPKNAPPALAKGFEVAIDFKKNRWRTSFEQVWTPIKTINDRELVLSDYAVERGVDNNPMHGDIRLNRSNLTLEYDVAAAAVVPMNLKFSTKCRLA